MIAEKPSTENQGSIVRCEVVLSLYGLASTYLRFIRCCGRAMIGRLLSKYCHRKMPETVRSIALTPTQGLTRGMTVEDTDGPFQAPVGPGLLSRMFDVFGNTIDRGLSPTNSSAKQKKARRPMPQGPLAEQPLFPKESQLPISVVFLCLRNDHLDGRCLRLFNSCYFGNYTETVDRL